jgi:hypothetical protein
MAALTRFYPHKVIPVTVCAFALYCCISENASLFANVCTFREGHKAWFVVVMGLEIVGKTQTHRQIWQ